MFLFDGGDGIVLVGQTHQKTGIAFVGLGDVVNGDGGKVFVQLGCVAVFFGDGFNNGPKCGFAPCFFLLLGQTVDSYENDHPFSLKCAHCSYAKVDSVILPYSMAGFS